jgi:hypothetical protein
MSNREIPAFTEMLKHGKPFEQDITPELAAHILHTCNPRNRDRSKAKVEEYRKAMEAGEWEHNGSSIVFAKNGDLMDGQHRLSACVEANKPFKTDVSCGKDASTIHTVDVGLARTVKSHLALLREDDASIMARVLTYFFRWEIHGTFNGKAPSNVVIEGVRTRHGDGLREAVAAVKPVLEDSDYAGRVPLVATLRYIISTKEPEVTPYFDALVKTIAVGDWETDADPAASIAKMMGPGRAQKRINDTGRVGILLSGFVSQLQGRKAAGLSTKTTHRFKQSELTKLLDQLALVVQEKQASQPKAA